MKNILAIMLLLSVSSATYAGVSIEPIIPLFDRHAGKYGVSVKLQHGWLYGKAKGYRKLGGKYGAGVEAGIIFRF